jgi:hypothetical protein
MKNRTTTALTVLLLLSVILNCVQFKSLEDLSVPPTESETQTPEDYLIKNYDPLLEYPPGYNTERGCFFVLNAGMTHLEVENLNGTISWFRSPQMFNSKEKFAEEMTQLNPIANIAPIRFDGVPKRIPIPSTAYAFLVVEDRGDYGEYSLSLLR